MKLLALLGLLAVGFSSCRDTPPNKYELEDQRFEDACHKAGGFVLFDRYALPTDCKMVPSH